MKAKLSDYKPLSIYGPRHDVPSANDEPAISPVKDERDLGPIAPPQKVYKAEEAAGILNMPTDTLYRLVREGKIDKIPIGNRNMRISQDAIERFIKCR